MKSYVSPEIEKLTFLDIDAFTANGSLTGNGGMEGTIPENWNYGD